MISATSSSGWRSQRRSSLSAHRRARAVERGRGATARRRVALEDFKTAHGLRVEHHEIVCVIAGQARQLIGDIRLRIAQVGDERSGGRSGERPVRSSRAGRACASESVASSVAPRLRKLEGIIVGKRVINPARASLSASGLCAAKVFRTGAMR